DSSEEELRVDENTVTEEELGVEYFDRFLTRSELAYHKYLMSSPISSLFLRNPIIVGGSPSNLKIPCNIAHVHIKKAYIDFNSPINVMTGEPIRNSSSLKCVYFVNTIIILSKEDEPRKTEIVKQVTKDNNHESIVKVEEKSKESEGKKGEEKDDHE
nr:MAK10-like protein [Tanacetum cinerariifolium]